MWRELHDDIGQTITAIRTQAGIVQRLAGKRRVKRSGAHIEQLSLGVYDSGASLRPSATTSTGRSHAGAGQPTDENRLVAVSSAISTGELMNLHLAKASG